MINRAIQKEFDSYLFKGKAILIFGARQVGKTSLISKTVSGMDFLWLNGD